MPSPTPSLTASTARRLVALWSFPEVSGNRVGVETEWFTTPSASPPGIPRLHELLDPCLPLPSGSALTFEPGGQVEISSPPLSTSDEACRACGNDVAYVRAALAQHGVGLAAGGVDHERSVQLRTDEPRYVAMKAHWDHNGPAGRRMMCTTASVHINVDAGADAEGTRRWRLIHRLGPTLAAAFANSPFIDGRPSGWMSSRLATWLAIDPTRTSPADAPGSPSDVWADYALRANVMFIRTGEQFVPLLEPLPFGAWIEGGHELGFPTSDDLSYHLTTLFPPVRPHGWLEIRMIDMLPDPWWRVAAAVTSALAYDRDAGDVASAAADAADGLWPEAARAGLQDANLRASALACFDAALDALRRIGTDNDTIDVVGEYNDRYVRRGRCPAGERLELASREPELNTAEAV